MHVPANINLRHEQLLEEARAERLRALARRPTKTQIGLLAYVVYATLLATLLMHLMPTSAPAAAQPTPAPRYEVSIVVDDGYGTQSIHCVTASAPSTDVIVVPNAAELARVARVQGCGVSD
jgi:hypothetical protein